MNVNFSIKLTPKQQEVYNLLHKDDVNIVVTRFSRQCGKTVLAEVLLIENLLKENSYSVYISPTFQLGRKVYKEITTMLNGKGLIKKANSSTLTIETVFNSTLQFFSIEAYTSIRGTTVSGILVLDECGYYPDLLPNGEEPWSNVIMPITKARKPKVLMISTPRGKRGMFWEFYNRALNGDNGIVEVSATIYDDALVTEREIEEIKKQVSDLAFQQEFLVKFLDSSLTYFTGFEKCFDNFKYNHFSKQWIGIDLSANGKDETIVTKINTDNQVEQYTISGTLDSKYKQMADIINNANNLQGVYIEGNSIGAPIINEIKKLVKRKSLIYEWTTTNKSKNEILSNLAVKIASKEIKFNIEDTALYSQFGTFITKWTKSGNIQLEAQQGHKDDKIMSLGIALQAKEDIKTSNDLTFVKKPTPFKIQ